MRLFLDAHVSGRRIATALRERGHEIRAADEECALDGSEDEALLELATVEDRIMVSFNVRDSRASCASGPRRVATTPAA